MAGTYSSAASIEPQGIGVGKTPTARPGSVNRASKFRGEADFYPTPPGATWALCNLGILPHRIWEPACGDGAMARVLEDAGHDVFATDLVDRGFGLVGQDFLQSRDAMGRAIVTNPPFGIIDPFIRHALDLEPPMLAIFARTKILEGRKRHSLIMGPSPPAEVHIFIERVKFFSGDHAVGDQPGWNTESFAWFIWRHGHAGPPRIGWVSRDSGRIGTSGPSVLSVPSTCDEGIFA